MVKVEDCKHFESLFSRSTSDGTVQPPVEPAVAISQRPQHTRNAIILKEQHVLSDSSPPSEQNPQCPNESDDNSQSGREVESTDELGLYDIVCGRHKAAFNNIGNRRFRVTVSLFLSPYTNALTRKDKSTLIKRVADLIRSNGGRFLHKRGGVWVELSQKQTHEKVGHALRDLAMGSIKSGSSSQQASSQAKVKSASLPDATATTAITSREESSESDLLQDQGNVKHIAEAVVQEMEAIALEPFERSANEFSNNDTLSQDDHSLAPVLEDQHAVGAIAQVDDPTEAHAIRRESVDANLLSWLVDESDFVLGNVELWWKY